MGMSVLLTDDASRDWEDIYDYTDLHNGRGGKADHVLDRIEKAFNSLTENPERGAHPKELLAFGLRDFREIFFNPYRIIYRIIEDKLYVLLIADGRRDMQNQERPFVLCSAPDQALIVLQPKSRAQKLLYIPHIGFNVVRFGMICSS